MVACVPPRRPGQRVFLASLADAIGRTNSLAGREISRMEHGQMRQYSPGGPARQMQNMSSAAHRHHDNRTIFNDDMGRLNKVWQT